ncbi:MAG: response regulator [Pseudomonadales bacterium]|nr:response regulator [Pseudomonadales bacterium]
METLRPRRHILFVDSNKSIVQSVKKLAELAAYSFHSEGNGFDALCSIARTMPDIIFMDMHAPQLDGFQTCVLLKSRDAYRHIPFILLSAEENLFNSVRAEVLGADRVLQKPFSSQEFLAVIAASLDEEPPAKDSCQHEQSEKDIAAA